MRWLCWLRLAWRPLTLDRHVTRRTMHVVSSKTNNARRADGNIPRMTPMGMYHGGQGDFNA